MVLNPLKHTLLTGFFAVCATLCSHAQDTLRIAINDAEKQFVESNLQLLAERYNIDISRAQVIQASLYANPNISFTGNFYNPDIKKYLDVSNETGEYGWNIQQLIILAGKRNKQVRLAQLNIKQSENNFLDLLRTLRYTLRSDFYNIYFTQNSINAYQIQVASLERLNTAYQELLARGTVSTEVAGAANDVSVSQSNLAIAQKDLQAAEDMYKSNLATEREVVSARLEVSKAQSELNRATQVSSITGGANATYVLTAPISGSIIEKMITNNSEVRQDNSTSLFTVADLSTVWIIANVYEADINKIHLGDEAIVNTLTDPDKNYKGRIDKIYDVLDPANRTMKVRISMPNSNDELKPEMFVTISVKEESMGRKLSIPSEAVVLDNSKHYTIVKQADSLAIREVQVLDRIGSRTFITGLAPGEQVVTNSQVFIYQALNTK